MPTAWPRYRSAFVLSFLFPWFPVASLTPPVDQSLAVVESATTDETQTTAPSPEEPLVLPGVVIEEIPKGSVLEKAGLQVGDVILSWERLPNPPANPEGARGKINGPFDWMWLEIEQAPRGVVTLMGDREGAPFSYEIALGTWDADIVPNFAPESARRLRKAKLLETAGEKISAIEEWSSFAAWLGRKAHAGEAEAWLTVRLGSMMAAQRRRGEAESHYLRAIELASDDLARSLIIDLAARFFLESGELRQAEKYFSEALSLQTAKKLGELGFARTKSNIATTLYRQGRKGEVDHYLQVAYEVYNKLAPEAPELIKILRNLGIRAKERGDLDQSIRDLQRSVAIAEACWPDSRTHAASLHALGNAEQVAGRIQDALTHLARALEMRERLEPGSANLASTLNALSLHYRAQGDLDQALVLARRSIGISEKLVGSEGYTAASLNSMALIEIALGQWSDAEADLERALELAAKSEQTKQLVPGLLANVAMAQENQGNLPAALQTYLTALELKRKHGLIAETALTLRSLGILYLRLGKREQALAYFTEALSLQRRFQPGSVDTADTLGILASALAESGDLATASRYFEEALKIVKAVAPTSVIAARLYSNYGVLEQRSGSLSVAKQYLQQAVDTSDALFLRASYSHDAMGRFGALNSFVYVNAADVYVALGEVEAAFEVTERMRGRSLMMQLAERDLLAASEIPDPVAEQIRSLERSLNIVEDENTNATEKGRSVSEQDMQFERRALFRERERLIAEIRRTSPRLAALRYPQAISAEDVRGSLDPGTCLVSFLVGAEGVYLFTVDRNDNVRVQALSIGEDALRQRIERFRGLLVEGRSRTALGELRAVELRRLSKDLYNLLVAPAADRIQKAERVLIVADGPLHYLPFGALVREVTGKDGLPRDQYLAEWKPFHSVLSATVYAEVKKDRRDVTTTQAGAPLLLGAFGAPRFPPSLEGKRPEEISDIRVRSAVRRGTLQFEPLPSSRLEVEGIAALFPPEQVAVFLGPEATEEKAKVVGKGVRILHFATHARLDEQFPLDSALVLTMPEGFPEGHDNGLLQVWEIFEKVRLDADLVVLSACDTALGEEQGGEGLIGLTRAFQYAGARSVMASLWSVQDRATSELMIRFYKHLRAGLSKDEALRQAQIELIRGPIEVVDEKGEKTLLDASAPYFWAGFQVYGDWQ